jgi:AMP phosphorylase
MGVTHVLIDLPYGKNTKLDRPDDLEFLEREFKELFAKFGIKCFTIKRQIKGPEGNGVGPALEIREALRVLEQSEDRSIALEDEVLDMAEILLENTGKAEKGQGRALAKKTLQEGQALEKFWDIAHAQGKEGIVKSEEIELGEITEVVKAEKSGTIKEINTRGIVDIARALGTPKIKKAGLYLEKNVGDKVEKGDVLATLYSETDGRIEQGKEIIDVENTWIIG